VARCDLFAGSVRRRFIPGAPPGERRRIINHTTAAGLDGLVAIIYSRRREATEATASSGTHG